MFQGAADQRCRLNFRLCSDTKPLSARNDVLVFQTAPLTGDTEVTGRLIVKLWAASNALDTDFTAKLVDGSPPPTFRSVWISMLPLPGRRTGVNWK